MASYHYKKMHMPRQHSCRAMYIEHSITPWMKGEWNSHRIWISMVKSFVNWTPRPELNQDFACWGLSHEDLRCHNYPRPVLAFGYCHCLRLWVCVSVCVCLCINHELVRPITHGPFKLGSPNLNQICKTPWSRSLLFLGMIDLDLQGQI